MNDLYLVIPSEDTYMLLSSSFALAATKTIKIRKSSDSLFSNKFQYAYKYA